MRPVVVRLSSECAPYWQTLELSSKFGTSGFSFENRCRWRLKEASRPAELTLGVGNSGVLASGRRDSSGQNRRDAAARATAAEGPRPRLRVLFLPEVVKGVGGHQYSGGPTAMNRAKLLTIFTSYVKEINNIYRPVHPAWRQTRNSLGRIATIT